MVKEFAITNPDHTQFMEFTDDSELMSVSRILDSLGQPITTDNPLPTNAEISATVNVATEEFIGFDNVADTWIRITAAGEIDDTIQVLIDQSPTLVDVTSTLTATEANDPIAVAALIVSDLNNDNTFSTYFEAKSLNCVVFIYSKFIAEKGEYTTSNDFRVVVGGAATPLTVVSIDSGFENIQRRFKKVLIEPDPNDNRYGRIGVFGDVGALTKADNPINICVRKSVASTGQQVFSDKTVPTNFIWYIGGVAVADDVGGEFTVWEGVERDNNDNWSADGTLFTEILSYGCLENSSYHAVTVNGSGTYTEGDDYAIEDCPTDETKSQLRWIKSQSMPDNGDTVQIIYDAVIRRAGLFVSASSSQDYTFQAPLKLQESKFVIGTVQNKSANAAIVILNLSGFSESKVLT